MEREKERERRQSLSFLYVMYVFGGVLCCVVRDVWWCGLCVVFL